MRIKGVYLSATLSKPQDMLIYIIITITVVCDEERVHWHEGPETEIGLSKPNEEGFVLSFGIRCLLLALPPSSCAA